MPIRYEKDRNGQWKAIGVASRDELQPRELPAGSPEAKRAAGFSRGLGARATLRGRPVVWAGPELGWQSPKSFEKAKSQGRLPKPASTPVNRRTGLSWWANEAKWILKSIGESNAGYVPTGTLPPIATSPGSMFTPVQYRDPQGRVRFSTPSERQVVAASTVGALDNALKSGEALVQSLQGKEVNPGQAAWIRGLANAGYQALGAKPPAEQNQFEQGFDSTFRSVGINAAVSAAMAPLAPFAVGATAVGTAARGAGLFVGEQFLSTALDDNTQGSASNLAEGLLASAGIRAQVPGAVRPTDDWGEATRKSLIPNTVAAGIFGAGAALTAKAFGVAGGGMPDLPFTRRWLKERRVTSEVQRARAWAEERGLIVQGDQGFVNRYSPPEFVGDLSMGQRRPAAAMPDAGPAMDVQAPTEPAAAGVLLDRPAAALQAPGPAMGIEGAPSGPVMADVALQGPEPIPTSTAYSALAGPVERQPRTIGIPDAYSPIQERLQQMDAARNPDTAAYQQWLEQNQRVAGIPSQQMEMGGAVLDGDLPRFEAENGDPWVDPTEFNPIADPALPETDQLVRDVWDLDDASLIAAAEGNGPVVQEVNQQLASQRAFDPAGDPRFTESAVDLATAPGEALGFSGPDGFAAYEARLRGEDWSGLRALTDPDNNPRVARIIAGNTGRDASEFTREDMIEGLLEVARADNRFVIPRPNGELNRPGEVVMPVEDLGVDPSRFQFKGGINPTTGEQLGQSLEGVDAWNTDLEGTVSAWRDPVDGSAWVVNGHNRVAAARRLGVKSLPVKFYEAPDARGARAIGAAQNIATGQGTPIDAAKFMRDTGVTDMAQLQALVPGMPMKSGWAEQGLALSRLPDDAFAAVVQGDLSPARGALIGASGKAPEEMSALWRYAEKRNVSDRVLRELVAMTAPDATATPDVARQGSIWDVLGGDSAEAQAFNAGLLTKARLVDRVRSRLSADRRLFATVAGRGAAERLQAAAANTIDATGTRAVAEQANQVLGVFDQLRYQTGPVGDLLNQGVVRLDAGEKLDAVAADVAGRVADAMEQTLGGGMVPPGGERLVALPSAEQIAWAEANLLSPKKLANRQAKKAQFDAQWAAVADVVSNPEKYADLPDAQVPKAPRKADDNRVTRELQAHAKAEEILAEVAAAEQRGPLAAEAVAAATEPAPTPQQAPVRLTAEQREQLQVDLVQRAIDSDEVRPPTTPEPELLEGPKVPLAQALDTLDSEGLQFGNDAAQAVADELRLAAEYSYRDAAIQKAAKEAFREETGYYELDPSERMASGQFRDGFRDEPVVGSGLDDRAAYARQQRQQAEAAGDTERANAWRAEERQLERSLVGNAVQAGGQSQQGLFGAGEYDTTAPLLNQPAQGADPAAAFQLPAELQRSAPRYGMATIKFSSDLDRAAYVLANDAVKPSKAAAKFRSAVEAAGLNVDEVIAHGRKVKQAIKEASGGGAAPQSAAEINLPAQRWSGAGRMANPELFDELADPSKGPSLDRLLFETIPPVEREQLLKKVGKERLDGVWTLGQEGAANRIEEDILKFVQKMTGGTNADVADAVFVRTNNAGYGGGGVPMPEQVGGVQADNIYNEEGAVLLISRYDNLLRKQGLAELAQTGVHEAVHYLQTRRLTQKQLEVLTSDEATAYFRTEAGKARAAGADSLANIELMAWGSQRVIAARLLRDMEALYRKQGLKKAADYVARARAQKLGEYKAPPTRLEKALEPLIGFWERIKNYLLGAGFKRNAELSPEQVQVIARFTDETAQLGFEKLARLIDSRGGTESLMPAGVRELLDAAYTGQIGKQMYLRPGRMGEKAFANYEKRWDLLGVSPSDYEASRFASQPAQPVAPTPPRRPKPLQASPAGLVPAELAAPLSPFGPMDLLNNPLAVGPSEFALPEAVLRSTPLYGKAEVQFSSPLDQVAYVLAREGGAAPPKATNQLRKALEAAGYDPADVARYGRETVQPAVRAAAGGGSAPQQAGAQLQLPEQGYQGPTRLPRVEVQRLKAQAVALDQELASIDAELAQLTKQSALGGCN